jgi:hypothetical protein
MGKSLGFRPIELKDKHEFDSFLGKNPPQISEMTFTNLFCWRLSKGHEFAIHKGHLIVSFSDNGIRKLYQPIGPEPAKIIEEVLRASNHAFERVDRSIAERLLGKFKVLEDRSMADYVYRVSDMRDLPGDKYSQKRNFIKRFSACGPTACVLDVSTARDFLDMQERWCDMRNCQANPEMNAEDIAVKECLNNFKALDVHGICIRVDGVMQAFAIGEKLNTNTFVEHFEKANTEFNGIYQYVAREFARSIPVGFEFLNREQDLGVEGLRKAKLSYHPALMVEKCSISR